MSTDKKTIEKYNFELFKKEQKPYSMILNKVIQTFSPVYPVPFAIWVFLESMNESWKPNKYHIMKTFSISERTYHAHMKVLSNCNLIQYSRPRFANGTLGKVTLTVLSGVDFIFPPPANHTAKICIVDDNHTAKKPQCGEPTCVANCAHNNINTINTNKHNIKDHENACAREISSGENLDKPKKPSEAGSQRNENFVDSHPQLSEENSDMPINPDYVYPETYYGMQDNTVSPVNDEVVSSDVLDSFARFWDLYPRKHNKKAALEAWVKFHCYAIEEKILTKLVEQVERDKIFIEGYAPNPENYLKGRRWEDEIYEVKKRNSTAKVDINMEDTSWARPENRTISEVVERGIEPNEDGWFKRSRDMPERAVKSLLNWI